MGRTQQLAELGYSQQYERIELLVPHGTKTAALAKVGDRLFADLLSRLPRGCQACLSGESLNIRERLEHVLHVDLDRMEIVDLDRELVGRV